MNDADARRLLTGVDGPRPLPGRLRTELLEALAEGDLGLRASDEPRPLPDDLRRRLEASLVRPATVRPSPHPLTRRLLAAAAAVVVMVGALAVASRQPDGDTTQVAGPGDTVAVPSGGSQASGGAVSGGTSDAGGAPPAPPSPLPFASGDAAPVPDAVAGSTAGGGSGASSGGGSAPAAADSQPQVAPIEVAVSGSGSAVAAGFDAYLRTLNGSGGIDGRQVVVVDGDARRRGVAHVNLGTAPLDTAVDGVLFETVYVDGERLRGPVLSMASPLEAQARLAVAHAFPERGDRARAAVYTSGSEPWDAVAAAFEDALRQRGVAPLRVPFNAAAPTFVPADAAFLALAPDDVRGWLDAAPSAPSQGTWGVASAWDDALAGRGAELSLRVLSPYAPVGGDEQAALAGALPEGTALSAAAVHGWVTAKALAVLLAADDGSVLTEADLDRLAGFDPGWAPPFTAGAGTKSRTPEAVVLRPADGRFTADGGFQRP